LSPKFGADKPSDHISKLAILLLSGTLIYALIIATERLFLSPLARFPGPKLAALSNWYEFYYDVILQGRFTEKIQELHRQHGRCLEFSDAGCVEFGG
jgi:hypothetical protein